LESIIVTNIKIKLMFLMITNSQTTIHRIMERPCRLRAHLIWLLEFSVKHSKEHTFAEAPITRSPLYGVQPYAIPRMVQLDRSIKMDLLIGLLKYLKTNPDVKSNFDFLIRLNAKREWSSHCMICLEDECMGDIRGKNCSCGHREVTIFRPCAHAMCTQPCYIDFSKSNNKTCPMCRAEIADVIEMSMINYNGEYTWLDALAQELRTKYDLWYYL
jgi:hypothetical protein